MEANSDEEQHNRSKNNVVSSNEGQSKPKRQMKTPFQLETLEKAYATETYPSEEMRAELSEKLGLSDRQLQMWFCHRRLKDKKETPVKKQRNTAPLPDSPLEEMRVGAENGSDYGSGSGSGSSPLSESRKVILDDGHTMRRYYDSSPQSVMELRAIACVEAQLGEPLREDGPILGMEFDPLPPDAFGTPIASITEQQKRMGYSYEDKVYERHDAKSSKDHASIRSDAYGLAQSPYQDSPVDTLRGRASPFGAGQISRARLVSQQDKRGHVFSSPQRDDDYLLQRDTFANNRTSAQSNSHPIMGPENPNVFSDAQTFHHDTELRLERKRKIEEPRTVRDVEAYENRMRKELEKQDILRRKNEERMRKEMERHDRERRKEEERLMRERQREEERLLREQKRELERREKFMQKEYLRAEKRRQKEELRREKEAVKRKAAMEKATARKIAKDSLDLIEDEQLELMELAAASKGLASIVNLNYDTLQNLDSFRDLLITFPSESVQLKKPFGFQPWSDSEENIGNLLMVWRFFITFTDVLGLWPFTLDEFVQAFHDYDSRLLSELHVALLKLIIKDIEDVARTPSFGLGINQYYTANPEGGHPQIVQGAYKWGFDIRNWQQHLNPLTWPEILRQLALSAGFGPQLRKRNGTWTGLGDIDEMQVKDCEDIISTIRNGSAAENAFALMREKGLLLPRKSRHRLTPGTVKFAAFHVLSLEGSKGLTVLELADKIQKSGLRDLTTSKTPEASISVALTRDQKLFERIAPSTYCVRAAFRKDPADAESILAAARKKIRIFENGFLGGEVADDVERDEDSEGDVDEDPEVDDLATPLSANKSTVPSSKLNTLSVSGKYKVGNDISLTVQNESEKGLSTFSLNGPKDVMTPIIIEQCVTHKDEGTDNGDGQYIEIDESKSGESWIQGLTEGEYSHLSVEERLNALVVLVGIANEGNSIRAVLEDRLEAANALKKQMWAEAQLDRSRLKEEFISKLDFPSLTGGRVETQVASSAVEGSQSPLVLVDSKNKEASPSNAEDQKSLAENVENHLSSVLSEKALVVQDLSMNPDNISVQQHGYASKRSRSQLKAYVTHLAEEMYIYRSLPLGQDRRRNRYWQFVASASRNDPCSGRIFVELHDGNWRVIDSEEAFDTLLSSLDTRGVRESHLRIMLQKIESSFKENGRRNLWSPNIVCQSGTTDENKKAETDSSNCPADIDDPSSMFCVSSSDTYDTFSLFRIELGRNSAEKKGALKRYLDFQNWMWKDCFNSSTLRAMKFGKKRCEQLLDTCNLCFSSYLSEDTHCLSCHQTFKVDNKNFDFAEHEIQCKEKRFDPGNARAFDSCLPLGIRLLTALLGSIEVSVPQEALESFWMEICRKDWVVKLIMSSSTEELLQRLTVFESAIKRERLSSNFETTKELLGPSASSGSAARDSASLGSVSLLPWMPKTSAAVALRLFELDASIIYVKNEKPEPSTDKSVKVYMKLPSRYSDVKNEEVEIKDVKLEEHNKEEIVDLRGKRSNYKRGRGGRDQGLAPKWQRRVPGLKSDTGRQSSSRGIQNLNQGPRQQGRKTNLQASSRGRRTVRKRRVEKTVAKEPLLGRMTNTVAAPVSYLSKKTAARNSYVKSFRNLDDEDWSAKKGSLNVVGDDNSNSMEEAESDDNVEEEVYEQGNWEPGFNGTSNGWNRNSVEVSDDDGDASNGIAAMVDDDSEGDIEMSDGSDREANQVQNDEGLDYADSDEYSD
ncbi:homeobox-DDT domain protein RLT1 isoform X1 [Populus alba]|uniref:homeobox-DDT domain protein RLT1 isoform X1 n=1 Tax=Populus alba TaxID=43335 RepID=UPI0015898F56|nr:homeobox-DDT domain protein RLT1 isoform X1 [Populus alba]